MLMVYEYDGVEKVKLANLSSWLLKCHRRLYCERSSLENSTQRLILRNRFNAVECLIIVSEELRFYHTVLSLNQLSFLSFI